MDTRDKGTSDALDDEKRVPQSQRPGGKKRKVALFVAFVGVGYSVSDRRPDFEMVMFPVDM
jgi:hypothetical protein